MSDFTSFDTAKVKGYKPKMAMEAISLVGRYFIAYKFEPDNYGSCYKAYQCGRILTDLFNGNYLVAVFKSAKDHDIDYEIITKIETLQFKPTPFQFRFYDETRFKEEIGKEYFS